MRWAAASAAPDDCQDDGGHAAIRHAAHGEHDRDAGLAHPVERLGGGAAGGRDDEAGNALLHHRLQHLLLADRIFGGVGDEGNDTGRLEDALHADGELGEEGVRQVVDDHADDVGMRLAQIGGAAVVDIADILDRLADFCRRLGADQAAALEDQRNCRLRHAGFAGDVEDRRLFAHGQALSPPPLSLDLLERSKMSRGFCQLASIRIIV